MIHKVINKLKDDISITFSNVHDWFDVDNDLLHYKSKVTRWNINEILEHIYLTNFYLLILIRKGVQKSLIIAAKKKYIS